MGAIAIRIAADPFDVAVKESQRYAMHMKLNGRFLLDELPDGYTVESFSIDKLHAFGAVLFQGFLAQPERNVYPRLATNVGCRGMAKELTDMPGFLARHSYVIMHNGVPVAGIITSRSLGCVFGQIHLVAVAHRHRRLGLGSYLTKRVLNEFQDLKLMHASLHVLGDNRQSIKFFRVMGFRAAQHG